jgi:signal transduction histidine kinase
MSRWKRTALWILAVVIVMVGEAGFFLGGFAPYETLPLDMSVGFVTMAAGIVTLSRRPENRIGPMLFVAGSAWSLAGVWSYWVAAGGWSFADRSIGYDTLLVVGVLLQPVHFSIIVHLLFAYPDGRLHSRLERTLVAALYAGAVAIDLAIMADPVDNALLALTTGRSSIPFLDAVTSNGVGAIALAALFILARRWLNATPTARRILTPVLGAALLLAAVEVVAAVIRAGSWSSPPETAIFYAIAVAKLSVPVAFLFGLFRSTIERSGVGDLVIELGAQRGVGLRDALARALHDTSVEIAYRLPSRNEFVDADGRTVSLPQEDSARTVTMVERGGESLAAIIHDRSLLDEPALVEAVSAAARLAIDNERLQAEVRAKLEEVEASRARILEAADAERRRVERNLHDGAQQRLVTLSLAMGLLRDRIDGEGGPELAAQMEAISKELRGALEELRELARGIHPSILTEEGLQAAVESLVDRSTVPVSLEKGSVGRLPETVEATAYFVVAEALTNVAKYANASRASVHLIQEENQLRVKVSDDGVGGADVASGSGLRGLEDRVAALGGQLLVESRRGAGTTVRAEIPLDER